MTTFTNVASNGKKRAVFDDYRESNDDKDDTDNDTILLRANCSHHPQKSHTHVIKTLSHPMMEFCSPFT